MLIVLPQVSFTQNTASILYINIYEFYYCILQSLFLSWYLYIEHGVAGFNNYANRYSWLEQLMGVQVQTSQPYAIIHFTLSLNKGLGTDPNDVYTRLRNVLSRDKNGRRWK